MMAAIDTDISKFMIELWASYTTSQIVWTAAGLVLLIFSLVKGCRRGYTCDSLDEPVSNKPSIQSFIPCHFPDCVRCRKYSQILDIATDKLFRYVESQPSVDQIQKVINTFKTNHYARHDTDIPPGDQRPNVYFLPGLTAIPVWTPETYHKDLQILCSSIAAIWKEYKQVAEQMDDRWSVNSTPSGVWTVYYLYNQGNKIKRNCEACPLTVSVLDKLPSFMRDCVFCNAGFSVIYPGTDIEEHYGPTNIRIRCHIGLEIPAQCLLQVNKKNLYWKEGEALMFDDSYLHSAHHCGEDEAPPRAILMLDFWHPQVTRYERDILTYIFKADNRSLD